MPIESFSDVLVGEVYSVHEFGAPMNATDRLSSVIVVYKYELHGVHYFGLCTIEPVHLTANVVWPGVIYHIAVSSEAALKRVFRAHHANHWKQAIREFHNLPEHLRSNPDGDEIVRHILDTTGATNQQIIDFEDVLLSYHRNILTNATLREIDTTDVAIGHTYVLHTHNKTTGVQNSEFVTIESIISSGNFRVHADANSRSRELNTTDTTMTYTFFRKPTIQELVNAAKRRLPLLTARHMSRRVRGGARRTRRRIYLKVSHFTR